MMNELLKLPIQNKITLTRYGGFTTVLKDSVKLLGTKVRHAPILRANPYPEVSDPIC